MTSPTKEGKLQTSTELKGTTESIGPGPTVLDDARRSESLLATSTQDPSLSALGYPGLLVKMSFMENVTQRVDDRFNAALFKVAGQFSPQTPKEGGVNPQTLAFSLRDYVHGAEDTSTMEDIAVVPKEIREALKGLYSQTLEKRGSTLLDLTHSRIANPTAGDIREALDQFDNAYQTFYKSLGQKESQEFSELTTPVRNAIDNLLTK